MIRIVKANLIFNLSILNRFYIQLLLSDLGRNLNATALKFQAMFNFRSRVLGRSIRVYRDKTNGYYSAVENKQTRTFENKSQNFYSYKNGFASRDQYLVGAYLLKEVAWSKHNFVIDCGANVGDFHFALSSIGIEHKYVAFEPSPTEHGCLSRNVPAGSCHNLGLWESNGELDFYVSMNNADSSFIKPESYTEIRKITTTRLDSIDLGNEKITLLKLEAEGAELEVLKGCTGILDRIQFISADLGFERGGESPLPEVTNFLSEHGFEMIKFGYPRIVALYASKLLTSRQISGGTVNVWE